MLEENLPDGIDPVEWLLLTTCAVRTVEAAIERLDWYACRWGIEILHEILKSGCQIEARQLETAARIKRDLPIVSVIVWRILYATMLSRALSDADATAILEPENGMPFIAECVTPLSYLRKFQPSVKLSDGLLNSADLSAEKPMDSRAQRFYGEGSRLCPI